MKKLLLFLSVALLSIACSKSEGEPEGGSGVKITLDTAPINMTSEGGTKTLSIESTGEWRVSGTNAWCTVSPESGVSGKTQVTISIKKEDLTEDRNTVLSFGDKTITVTQKKTGALILTQDKYDLSIAGGEIEVEVNHNVQFDVVIPFNVRAWITQVDAGKALPKTNLKFKIAESTEEDKREGFIIIKDKTSDLADTIKVFQAQNDVLLLSDNNQTITNAGGDLDVELRTNISYDITIIDNPTWFKINTGSKAVRVDKSKFSVDPLTGDDNREAMVVFADKNSSLKDTLVVCQIADGALFLMKSKFDFDKDGGIVIVKLRESNFETEVIAGIEWLSPIPMNEIIQSKGLLKTDSIRFISYANFSTEDREGRILIKDKSNNLTDTIKVSQKGRPLDEAGSTEKRALWGSIMNNKNAMLPDIPSVRNKILISWRMLTSDKNVAFDLYRTSGSNAEVKVNTTPITETNYQDITAPLNVDNTYRLCYSGSSTTIDTYKMSATQSSQALPYISIPLKSDVPIQDSTYRPNDVSIGDLDGDGVYEIVVKRFAVNHDTMDGKVKRGGTTMLYEAYKLDGTFMWRVDCGPNVRQGNHYGPFLVYDLNGDGRAEVVLKTSEGTKFGDGATIGDADGDGKTNYEDANGYVNSGPEYLSVINGITGAEIARVDYIARGNINDWGDNYGHRADKFFIAAAYLDGKKPSIVITRGIYTKIILEAWNLNGTTLTKKWRFDTTANNGEYKNYEYQGNHNLRVGDVDADGRDEIVYGACCIDDNGRGLYTTKLGHGDAIHLGDFDPTRAGLEVVQCHESAGPAGIEYRDARTGRLLWGFPNSGDVGRAMVADIDRDSPGCEVWWAGSNVYSSTGVDLGYTVVSNSAVFCNQAIWWTGSINRQLFDRTFIGHDNKGGRAFSIHFYDAKTINGTKDNPCFYGDILGDWREEIIMPNGNDTELRIFSTFFPCEYKFPYLMSDRIYRLSAVHQNLGYNQPTHTGYYIGSDLLKK